MKYAYLNDKEFLKEFDKEKLQEQIVKISLMTFDEKPVRDIIGKAISGSINLDGKGNVRRTCSLTIIADEYDNDLSDLDREIAINKKFILEIGVFNNTDKYTEYPIIWFPQGVYVMLSASLSKGSGATTISIQAKDKMCLLNGECGGVLPAAIDGINKADYYDEDGNLHTKYVTIYEIIKEMVHHWGEESLNRIIINDIDERVKQVKKWIGKKPLYRITRQNGEVEFSLSPKNLNEGDAYKTYNYGEDLGFVYTDFTYPGEFSSNAGETITSVLDKIRDTLGNYEYFYDIEGNFVFQEKRNYLNTSFSTLQLNKINEGETISLNDLSPRDYYSDYNGGKTVYNFNDGELIAAYTTTPQWNNIKNDFVVWGKRKDYEGKE